MLRFISAIAVILISTGVALADATSIVPRVGHGGSIEFLEFGPDSSWLLSASNDGVVKIWDVATKRLLRDIQATPSRIVAVALAKNGTVFATSDSDGVYIFESKTGNRLRVIKGFKSEALALSPDGEILVAEKESNLVAIETKTGKLRWSATTYKTGKDGNETDDSDKIQTIAFPPHGKWVVTGGTGASIKIWDPRSGKMLKSADLDPEGDPEINAIAISSDAKLIAVGTDKAQFQVWNAETLQLVGKTAVPTEYNRAKGMTFTADSLSLVALSRNTALLLNVSDPNLASRATLAARFAPNGKKIGDPTFLATSSDNKRIALGRAQGQLEFIDALGNSIPIADRIANNQNALSVSADGKTFIANGFAHPIKIWDIQNGKLNGLGCGGEKTNGAYAVSRDHLLAGFTRREGKGKEDPVAFCKIADDSAPRKVGAGFYKGESAFSMDGNLFATVFGARKSYEQPSRLQIWNTVTNTQVVDRQIATADENTAKDPFNRAHKIVFSPDGSKLVVANYVETPKTIYQLTLLNAQDGSTIATLYDGDVNSIKFSQDGKVLAAADRNTIRFFNIAEQRLVNTVKFEKLADLFLSYWGSVVISDDLKWVVIANYNEFFVFDAEKGKIIQRASISSGLIRAIQLSPDSRFIFVSSSSDTIDVFKRETLEKLLTLYSPQSSPEWIAYSPEGFFAGSAKGVGDVSVVSGFKAIGADRLFQSLYRPDLVREKLAGDPKGLVKTAAATLGLDKILAFGSAPTVKIVSPVDGVQAAEEFANVEVEISDSGGGIGRIEWRIDGVTLGIDSVQSKLGVEKASRKFALAPGDNAVEVVAYNAEGLIASSPASVVIGHKGDEAQSKPRLYVVGVGVNAYEDPDLRLNFPVADVVTVTDSLAKSAKDKFSSVEITRLLDADVSSDRIEALFAELSTKVRSQDTLIFFIAGHGKTLDGRYYFIPPKFKLDGEASIRTQGIGQEALQTWFARIAARRSIFMSDTCESGSLTLERAEASGSARIAALDRLSEATGRIVLAASTDDAPALEGVQGHGVFSYAFLDGLAHADNNKNGTIEVSEIEGFLRQRIPEISQQLFGQRQVPQTKISGVDFLIGAPIQSVVEEPKIVVADARGFAKYILLRGVQPVANPGAKPANEDKLDRGMKVRAVKNENGWTLIAQDGKELGWIKSDAVATLK